MIKIFCQISYSAPCLLMVQHRLWPGHLRTQWWLSFVPPLCTQTTDKYHITSAMVNLHPYKIVNCKVFPGVCYHICEIKIYIWLQNIIFIYLKIVYFTWNKFLYYFFCHLSNVILFGRVSERNVERPCWVNPLLLAPCPSYWKAQFCI